MINSFVRVSITNWTVSLVLERDELRTRNQLDDHDTFVDVYRWFSQTSSFFLFIKRSSKFQICIWMNSSVHIVSLNFDITIFMNICNANNRTWGTRACFWIKRTRFQRGFASNGWSWIVYIIKKKQGKRKLFDIRTSWRWWFEDNRIKYIYTLLEGERKRNLVNLGI